MKKNVIRIIVLVMSVLVGKYEESINVFSHLADKCFDFCDC